MLDSCQLTKRYRPKEFKKAASDPSEAVRWLTISNPPGVRIMAKESQKPPYEDNAVAPKVLPTAISLETFVNHGCYFKNHRGMATHHMPASNWTRPPYPYAIATTKLGSAILRAPTLIKLRTKVVRAKALRPKGAGLANLRPVTGLYRPG